MHLPGVVVGVFQPCDWLATSDPPHFQPLLPNCNSAFTDSKERKLPVSGRKPTLVQRLEEDDAFRAQEAESDGVDGSDTTRMTDDKTTTNSKSNRKEG
ncbi:hypothetical protein V495_07043 [Pseudogymnoascus sp. VKM F-4514 (FW-929)]|nr:hypothetical protein V495_07043 [Pseudogymnoascus sp. VKM F-4514 (FW-929)]KFY51504.1 hypothetical protein V497_09090 [Pseudogymnoascus sp. VKM F-4516 (FW-969)]